MAAPLVAGVFRYPSPGVCAAADWAEGLTGRILRAIGHRILPVNPPGLVDRDAEAQALRIVNVVRRCVVNDTAGSGGRWIDVAPARFPGWIASFAARHGAGGPDAALAVTLTGEDVIFAAPDGASAVPSTQSSRAHARANGKHHRLFRSSVDLPPPRNVFGECSRLVGWRDPRGLSRALAVSLGTHGSD